MNDKMHAPESTPLLLYQHAHFDTTHAHVQQQRYEGAATAYGPHTLSAYIQEFKKLATNLALVG